MPFFRTVAASIISLGVLCSAQSWADAPDKPEDFIRRAMSAIQKKNYRYAVFQLKDALKMDKNNADAWNMLGFSYRMQGEEKFDLAWNAYEQALTLDPNHIDANEYLGELYLMQGQMDLAKEQLAKLDALCPTGCKERDMLAKAIADKAGS
ncbi:tetratricopeptide repeat protein [Hwanghaeella sp.]|uniref:tetratricopeptide repeat protein n=1 Tax=Hwanghaeella sp. TaxID=2605943 RepID=UPI003CCBA7A2